MGICATAAVLLQQSCNNTREGKEEKKKSRQVTRINLFTSDVSASQMNILLFCVSTGRKLVTLGVMGNKLEIYIIPTFKNGIKSGILCALRKKWRSGYISEKAWEKSVMRVVLIFVLSFKFSAGLVALKQLRIKEVSWQKSFGCENQFHYK